MPEVRLIDANALKDRIDSAFTTYGECTYVKGIIDAQPTIEAEPVRCGRWIVKGQDIYCSECKGESLYNPFGASKFSRFCPNCGAKMEEGE